MEYQPKNRDKKVAGRDKRRGYVQGKRSYLHAMVGSIIKRANRTGSEEADKTS